ncbi:MAG: sugar transferase [Candidatus Saganbacteria bacterium]|nr:sugar transferase [Candidatus Saganbacteria bacterium]
MKYDKLLANAGFVLLRVMSDVFFIFISFILAYFLRQRFGPAFQPGIKLYLIYLFYVALFWVAIFFVLGLYRSRKGFFVEIDEAFGLLGGTLSGLVGIIIVSFIFSEFKYSRILIFYAWPISFLLLSMSRIAILRLELLLKSRGIGSKKAVVLGEGELGRSIAEKIREMPSLGFQLVANVGSVKELDEAVRSNTIDEVFVAIPDLPRDELLNLAKKFGVGLSIVPDLFEVISKPVRMGELDNIPLMSVRERNIVFSGRIIKRLMDISISLVCLIIFAPIMLVIAGLIKISSPGGVFYRQQRVGRGGCIFILYKFRTMAENAEKDTGPILASSNDPRKTRLGKYLRRIHLDEMPQLFNVLKGDMSLVGPRPERPFFAEQYRQRITGYDERNNVRPGLAGLAQITGTYSLPIEEKVKYDFYYIENWSLILDIKLIVWMLGKALLCKNEY